MSIRVNALAKWVQLLAPGIRPRQLAVCAFALAADRCSIFSERTAHRCYNTAQVLIALFQRRAIHVGSPFAARLALSITIANRAPTVAVCDGPGGPFCDVVFNFPRFFLALPMGHRPGVRHIPEMYIIGQQSVQTQKTKNKNTKKPSILV